MPKLEFPIGKIMSVTDARNNFNKIVEEVEEDPEGKYLLTKGGSPSVVMVNANYLEKLTGEKTVTIEVKKGRELPQQAPPTSEKNTTPSNAEGTSQPPPSTPTVQQPPKTQTDQQNTAYQPPTQPSDPLKDNY